MLMGTTRLVTVHLFTGNVQWYWGQVYLRRDGSVQGPLWPRAIRDMVISKFIKVSSAVLCQCHFLFSFLFAEKFIIMTFAQQKRVHFTCYQ